MNLEAMLIIVTLCNGMSAWHPETCIKEIISCYDKEIKHFESVEEIIKTCVLRKVDNQ